MSRTARIHRKTAETDIELELTLDGIGEARVATGVGFLDHMLTLLAKHARLRPDGQGRRRPHVDQHHTVEDVGICLGQALREALGDKAGIRRYGHFTLPMEETLGHRRPWTWAAGRISSSRPSSPRTRSASSTAELVADFWQAFAANALCNLHIIVHYGRNSHHIAEAIFKATARALRMAVEPDPRMTGVPSTKGTL